MDDFGQTPLLLAASNGYKVVVKLFFIQDDINLNSKNKFRAIPLLLATEYRNKVIVELLLIRDDVNLNLKNAFKNTLLL